VVCEGDGQRFRPVQGSQRAGDLIQQVVVQALGVIAPIKPPRPLPFRAIRAEMLIERAGNLGSREALGASASAENRLASPSGAFYMRRTGIPPCPAVALDDEA
jgi:hypothetical protein